MKKMKTPMLSINKGMRNILIGIMNVDLWILITVGQYATKATKLLNSLLKIVFLMSIGAGLLAIYALSQLKLEVTDYEGGNIRGLIKSTKGRTAIGITDVSNFDNNPILEREISNLKNKALNLEVALRKMNSQLRTIYSCDRFKEEDLADFASEAAGGSVLETPETESYYEPTQNQLTLFGIPLYKANYYTPRKVIQPWTQAGECWAFRGQRGNVKIQLAYETMIERFTLEHIPATSSLTAKIDSAPKDFRVRALLADEYVTIGSFVYNQNGSPSQIFHVMEERFKDTPIKIVMLEILSNWGNPIYTCIYRFKVHGRIAP